MSQSKLEKLNAEIVLEDNELIKANPRQVPVGNNNPLIQSVSFEFGQADFKTAYVKLTDANADRYSPPESVVNKLSANGMMKLDMCGFEMFNDPFGFKFTDDKTGDAILTTENSAFIMMDKYMQLDMTLPSRRIFGLGERTKSFLVGEGTWTMWANGQQTPTDNGLGGNQTYGVHPFMLVQTATPGEYFGVYFRNTNAMSPVIQHTGESQSTFSYITTGGQIEIYLMFKGGPKDIIKQYQNIIGKPVLPPFWSLGWHAAAYAYTTQAMVQENIDGYATAGIPLEGIWLDIPYLDGYSDFSVNATAFPTVKDMTDTIHANGQRMIVIVDAGISSDNVQNKYYSQAIDENLLLLSSINPDEQDGKLTQHVWPNHTVFLDFFAEGTQEVWGMGLTDLYNLIPYDGLWLDMNEATGFCNGECPSGETNYSKKTEPITYSKNFYEFLSTNVVDDEQVQNYTWWTSYDSQNEISTYKLPFMPGGQWNLDNMSLSLNATHPSNGLREYDVHSLFGHVEGMVTRNILVNQTATPIKDKRTFLLSRSTFAGSGAYVQHWLGDNNRTWSDMKNSISGVMNFNMFGIPMVGPDTCGFFGASGEDELCGRWIQLATFYPFARQHRDATGGGDPNEPWRLEEPYQSMAKNALFDRLQYSRQMYTCLFEATQTGETCFDPLLFHYPNVNAVFENIEETFIAAGHLKVSPVLTAGATSVDTFFPNGDWVDLTDFSNIISVNETEGGKKVTLAAPADDTSTVNVHLKPGSIIQWQDNKAHTFMTTGAIQKDGTTALIMNRDSNMHASGKVFLDGGESLSELQNQSYEYYEFRLNGKTLTKWNLNSNAVNNNVNIDKIVIVNMPMGTITPDFACVTDSTGTPYTVTPTYNNADFTLSFAMMNGTDPIDFFTFQNLYFGDSTKDINLCNPTSQYYRTKDGAIPDLTGPTVSVVLENLQPGAFRDLQLDITMLATVGTLNVHWTYADMTDVKIPFEMPREIIDIDKTDINNSGVLSDFVVITQDATGPMTLEIRNGPTGTVVYTLNGMMLGEYINYIDATAHTTITNFKGVMGLMEQVTSDLWLKDGIFSLWSRDDADPVQTGKLPSSNMYGVHPFVMGKAVDGLWFGVLTNNAAAQDWRVKNDATTGDVGLTTIATGGSGDVYFMLSPWGPQYVTELYHSIIGTPVWTPQWALGWNQCRWGYTDLDTVRQVVANFTAYDLPLDTMWSDIDYLNNYQDFTFDPVRFNGLGEFVDDLHTANKHYIPIIDAGIAKRKGYEAYEDGLNQDVFIKTDAGDVFTGQVWPDDAAFPDWFAPNTAAWWSKWLSDFQSKVAFDGLWQDMNEASNFCSGVCYENERAVDPVLNKLPYTPTGRNLEDKSITLDAKHANGYTELDTHSLFGTMEIKATHDWFKEQGKRTMIIERSAYAGMGKYGSRWLGDNFSSAEYMGYSVTGIMSHNIAGIAMVGSDICGFIGNTTPELCARWYTLGAFYPFSRNHNGWGWNSQEPWVFANDIYESTTSYFDIIQSAMRTKLSMIRYYYTWMAMNSYGGGTFIAPLFFSFPDDEGSLNAPMETNIMVGPFLKLSIQSTALDTNSTDFYMPPGLWCNVFNREGTAGCIDNAVGTNVTLSTKAYEFYLHLMGGTIIPMQDGKNLALTANVSTTYDLQQQPVDIHVLPICTAASCVSSGWYVNDDGEVLDLWPAKVQNNYIFGYKQDLVLTPTMLTVNINHALKATDVNADAQINKNDAMSSIQIYNAAAMGISTGTWTSEATLLDGSLVALAVPTYDTVSDRLVFTNDQAAYGDLWIGQVKSITFTQTP